MEELAQNLNAILMGFLSFFGFILAFFWLAYFAFIIGVMFTGLSEHRKKRRYEMTKGPENGQ